MENVRIAGNGSVGWDGDLWDDLGDSNTFQRQAVDNRHVSTLVDDGCFAKIK